MTAPRFRVELTDHAAQRMLERGFTLSQIEQALETGQTIEEYPDARPLPARLILARLGDRPVHVVYARNEEESVHVIITVYEPSLREWEQGFARRRR